MPKRKKENYLDYIPMLNAKNTWDEKDGVVTINMVNSGFYSSIAQKFFHTPKVSHIDLDAYGSYVFKCIDGKRSVYDIGEMLKEEYREKAEPLYPRLVKYMQILHNNKFILFLGRDKKTK